MFDTKTIKKRSILYNHKNNIMKEFRTEHLGVKLTPTEKMKLINEAGKQKRSVSTLVQRLVFEYVNKMS